jgi:hypothetical protein
VPTISRLRNTWLPIRISSLAGLAFAFVGSDIKRLSSSHQGHNLEAVTVVQHAFGVTAARNYIQVQLDRQRPRIQLQRFQQLRDRRPGGDVARLSIHNDLHDLATP